MMTYERHADGDGHDESTHQIEISERQRERFDRIRQECKNDHIPAPEDAEMMASLMDTWDAVNEGYYSSNDDE